MTEQDYARLERELGRKLPEAYRRIITGFPPELLEWPSREPGLKDRRDDFLHDVDRILDATAKLRRKWKKEFPEAGVVFGGTPGAWWFFDAAQETPRTMLARTDWLLSAFDSLDAQLADVRKSHAEALARAQKQGRGGRKPALSADELLAEGRRLARPALGLYRKGKELAAHWRGAGVVSPGPGEWRHWISIDARKLPQNPRGLTGVISLYEWFADDDRMGELKVVHDPDATLPAKTDGVALYGRPFDCMPDIEAIFHFGSDKVKAWYDASWNPRTGYDRSPVKDYLRVLHREHPFEAPGGCFAMLGGWSWCFTWCYGQDEEYPWHLLEGALVVLTIEESEPWIEVFDDGTGFQALARIT